MYYPIDIHIRRLRTINVAAVVAVVLPFVEDTTETFDLREIHTVGLPSEDRLYVMFEPAQLGNTPYTYRTTSPYLMEMICLVCDYAGYDGLSHACRSRDGLNAQRRILIHLLERL